MGKSSLSIGSNTKGTVYLMLIVCCLCKLEIEQVILPDAKVGVEYAINLQGENSPKFNIKPVSALPPNFQYYENILSGKPKQLGQFVINVLIENPVTKQQAIFPYVLNVKGISLTNPNLPIAKSGRFYEYELKPQGGVGTLKLSLSSQPSWLSLQGNTLVGVPTSQGVTDFILLIEDRQKNIVSLRLTLKIEEALNRKSSNLQINPFSMALPTTMDVETRFQQKDIFVSHLTRNNTGPCLIKALEKEVTGLNRILSISQNRLQLNLMSGAVIVLSACTNIAFSPNVKVNNFVVGDTVSWIGKLDPASKLFPRRYLANRIVKVSD